MFRASGWVIVVKSELSFFLLILVMLECIIQTRGGSTLELVFQCGIRASFWRSYVSNFIVLTHRHTQAQSIEPKKGLLYFLQSPHVSQKRLHVRNAIRVHDIHFQHKFYKLKLLEIGSSIVSNDFLIFYLLIKKTTKKLKINKI